MKKSEANLKDYTHLAEFSGVFWVRTISDRLSDKGQTSRILAGPIFCSPLGQALSGASSVDTALG